MLSDKTILDARNSGYLKLKVHSSQAAEQELSDEEKNALHDNSEIAIMQGDKVVLIVKVFRIRNCESLAEIGLKHGPEFRCVLARKLRDGGQIESFDELHVERSK